MISKLQGDYNGSTNGPQGLSSFTRIPVSLSGKKSQLCSYQRCPISSTLPAGHAQTQEVPSSRQCQHRHQAHTDKSTPLLSTAWLNVVWLSSSLFRSLNPLTRAPSPSVKARLRGTAADLRAARCPWHSCSKLVHPACWALTEPHLSSHHHQQAALCSTTTHRYWAF